MISLAICFLGFNQQSIGRNPAKLEECHQLERVFHSNTGHHVVELSWNTENHVEIERETFKTHNKSVRIELCECTMLFGTFFSTLSDRKNIDKFFKLSISFVGH